MRDDWEKLSDEKSSLRACRRRIPNRSRVVSCESSNRSHVLLPLPSLFTPITSNSLQEDTHDFILSFFCASNVHTTSVVPRLSTSATLTRLGKKMLEYLYNWNTIQQ